MMDRGDMAEHVDDYLFTTGTAEVVTVADKFLALRRLCDESRAEDGVYVGQVSVQKVVDILEGRLS